MSPSENLVVSWIWYGRPGARHSPIIPSAQSVWIATSPLGTIRWAKEADERPIEELIVLRPHLRIDGHSRLGGARPGSREGYYVLVPIGPKDFAAEQGQI